MLFLGFVIVHLIPVISSAFFPTLDGPAHLYNARTLIELGGSNAEVLHQFYTVNDFLLPNWTGHLVLALLLKILPAIVVEKAFVALYVLGFAYAFRYVCKQLSPGLPIASYLGFPLIYSFILFLGFYNFLIGTVISLVAIGFVVRNVDSMRMSRKFIPYLLLVLLCYYSHLFAYLFLGLAVACFVVVMGMRSILGTKGSKPPRTASANIVALLLITVAPLLLYFIHSSSILGAASTSYLPAAELRGWILNARVLVALDFGTEEFYTKLFSLLVFVCVLFAVKHIVVGLFTSTPLRHGRIKELMGSLPQSTFLLLLSGSTLFLYFLMPDSNDVAGYASLRFLLLFFISLILWLASFSYSKLGSVLLIVTVAYLSVHLNLYYRAEQKMHSVTAASVYELAKYIEPNSTVLPIARSDHWLHWHFSGYLGLSKPMIILDNYEAFNGYFPLKWNERDIPNLLLGELRPDDVQCVRWPTNLQNLDQLIDYVLLVGELNDDDPCTERLRETLEQHHVLLARNGQATLYAAVDRKTP